MTVSFIDSCYFNSNNSGTSDFTVANNVTGWLTPAQAGAANNALYRYRAASANQSQWETGLGTYYSANTTLVRTTVINSSETNPLYALAGIVDTTEYTAYSNNGLTFQNSNDTLFNSYSTFYGLAYGNNIFVIVGGNNNISYSNDFINWTSATNPDSGSTNSTSFISLTYSPTGFYALDNNQHLIQSNDGITWSDKGVANTYTGLGANLHHATFIQYIGNTYFIGSDTTTNIGYSTDGSTWLSANVGFSFQKKVAFGNNTFVVIGNANTISYSENLTDWTATSVTAGYPRDIIYGDLGGFVAIATGNSSLTYGQVYTSSNGSSWTVSNTTYEISSDTDNIFYGMLLYDDSKYLIYNGYFFDEPIITSNNGTDWTTTSSNSSYFTYGLYLSDFIQKTNFTNPPKVALTFGANDFSFSELQDKPTTLAGYNISANDVLDTIKTVDGSGSGLDADTLDGHDSTYFQTALGYTPFNSAGGSISSFIELGPRTGGAGTNVSYIDFHTGDLNDFMARIAAYGGNSENSTAELGIFAANVSIGVNKFKLYGYGGANDSSVLAFDNTVDHYLYKPSGDDSLKYIGGNFVANQIYESTTGTPVRVYSPNNQPWIATSSTLPVGWSGAAAARGIGVADEASTPGSNIALYPYLITQTGTWKNITGGDVGNTSPGVFVRIA